jgi:hypothetical protein
MAVRSEQVLVEGFCFRKSLMAEMPNRDTWVE